MKHAWVIVALAFLALPGCKKKQQASGEATQAAATEEAVEIPEATLGAFQPLPDAFETEDNPLTEAKIKLGRMLYYEPRLSHSKEISCNTCHLLDQYGVDNKKVSEGHKGQPGERNSPTVYNAAGQFRQFWDGRAEDVEEQAKGPIVNPVEMAMPSNARVIADSRLESIPEYVQAFKEAFPDEKKPVTFENLAKAIGAFERKLVTPSRWDAFLKGDKTALTSEEKKGFNTFVASGCLSCHTGPLVGGMMYQKLGLIQPWPDQSDLGRYKVTKQEADKMMFKVPTLRNVEKTAPYFHDGSVASLEEAVKLMAKHQVGRELSDADTKSIVIWLKTLTGEIPKDYIAKPQLPGLEEG